jgi:adenylate kinase family enzyme
MDSYYRQTKPILDYYANRRLLTTLDATASIQEVTEEIDDAIAAFKKDYKMTFD